MAKKERGYVTLHNLLVEPVPPVLSHCLMQHIYKIILICSIFALIRSIIYTELTKYTAMLKMYFIHKYCSAFCWLYNRIITFHIDTHSYGDQNCIFRFAESCDGIYCLKKHSSNVSVVS
jgi:hypothetical protein